MKKNQKKSKKGLSPKGLSPKKHSASPWDQFKFWIADTGKQLAIAIVIVLVVRSSLVEPYKIPSGSMIPTLFIGDHIFVNKFAYGLKLPFSATFGHPIYITKRSVPKRGDVIVFRYPRDESTNYIKRVIGLPGDRIAVRNKSLFINDVVVSETPHENAELSSGIIDKADQSILTLYMADLRGHKHPVLHDERNVIGSDYGPITVPADKVFVMGDNRDRSSDSRAWGFVPVRNIKGKALFIWLNVVTNWSFDDFYIIPRLGRVGTKVQ